MGQPPPIPRASYTRPFGIEDPEARDRETAAAGLVKGETACNRRACQSPLKIGERWWNTSTRAYYCKNCALRINECGTLCIPENERHEEPT